MVNPTEGAERVDVNHDALTGLVNRAGFDLIYEHCVARCRRDGEPFSIVCFDLDPNVRNADPTGGTEASIVALASLLRSELRGCDVVARTRDDQFSLLLPWTDDVQVLQVIHHLAAVIREHSRHAELPMGSSALVKRATFDSSVDEQAAEFLADTVDGLHGSWGVIELAAKGR